MTFWIGVGIGLVLGIVLGVFLTVTILQIKATGAVG